MKKILCLLLCMAMLSGLFAVQGVSAQEIDSDIIAFLETLGIMKDIDPTSYTAEVTRESFAYYAAKATGISVNGNEELRRYIDVPTHSYAFSAINNLADAGIISKSADERFRPNDFITFGEACTIMLNAMGYKEYAQLNGAWPAGYIKLAKMLDISTMDTGKVMTLEETARLIYEAVKRPLCDIDGISGENVMYRESGETLLSSVFDIKYAEGCIEAFAGGAIESSDLTEANRVKISGEEFELTDGIDISNYFGDYVEYFFCDKSGLNELVYVHKAKGTKENIVIDIENFEGYGDNVISYYAGENASSVRKITLHENHTVLYNGMPLMTKVSATLANLNKGTVTLKDSNDDGKYDLVMITDYKNFVVRMYEPNSMIVYDRITSGNNLKLEDKNYVKIYSGDEEIEPESLVMDVVLSVAESQNGEVVTMLACGDLVDGTVQATSEDYVTIDGTKYEIEESYKKDFSVKNGMSYTFHLDSFGKIAYLSTDKSRRMKYAYIVDGTEISEGFDETYNVKMFTEDGEMVFLEFAKNVIIDGDKKDDINEIKAALCEKNTNKVKNQLVEFEVNKDGLIREMDTASERNDKEDPDYSLRPVFGDTVPQAWWWASSGRYALKALLTTSTIAIIVPEEADAEDKYYRIGTWKEATSSQTEWWGAVDMYYRNEDSACVDVIVKSKSATTVTETKNVVMVNEICETLNSEDEEITQIKGVSSGQIQTGSNVLFEIETERCDEGIEEGDLIVISRFATGELAEAKLIYDASAGSEPSEFVSVGDLLLLIKGKDYASYKHTTQVSFGYAKKVFDNGAVSMARYLGGDETERMLFPGTVGVYDSKTKKVYTGTADDVLAYDDCGANCSRIFYHTYNGVGLGVFIYK